jgi:L-ascorbate metabolism protein UlaG (beta-lactamase superfamily)
MNLTWFGTAGFRIDSDSHTILIDPYFSRNDKAFPKQTLASTDIQHGDAIFISHGHFDHIFDVPTIARQTAARVYCGQGADSTLAEMGLSHEQIHTVRRDGEKFDINRISAQAFFSRHVKFDRWLVVNTLARIHFRLFRYLPLLRDFPAGQVLSWRFILEGKVIHHFGSAGSTSKELKRLARQPTDILLVPLQGHTQINTIALNCVKILQPKLVIPHHQDNFYPPISTMVDIQTFIEGAKQECRETEIRVMEINESVEI